MTFGKWPIEMHYQPEQLRRIERARAIKEEDIIAIDRQQLRGTFYGSLKPRSTKKYIYYPTIDECTCGDFVNRRLPCKHMYRLATECGLLPDNGAHFPEVIAAVEDCPDTAQRVLKDILAINIQHNTGNVWVELNEEHTQITALSPLSSGFTPVSAELVVEHPFIKLAPIKLSDCTDRHINELLAVIGRHPAHDLRGKELVQWCENAVPEILPLMQNRFMVYVPFYRHTMREVFQYLCRKFDWNTYSFTQGGLTKKVVYPGGARFDGALMALFGDGLNPGRGTSFACYFPNDDITGLLTLYGHNRCVNGYKAVAE